MFHYGCYLSSEKHGTSKISLYLDRHTQKNSRRLAKASDEKPTGLFSYEVECSALVEDGRRDRIFPQSLTRMVDVDPFG